MSTRKRALSLVTAFLCLLFPQPSMTAQTPEAVDTQAIMEKMQQMDQEIQSLRQEVKTLKEGQAKPAPLGGMRITSTNSPMTADLYDERPFPNLTPAMKKELAGFTPVFGEKNFVKLKLATQVDVISDSQNANSPGQFDTSAIPVRGQSNYGGGPRTDISMRQSQIAIQAYSYITDDDPIFISYENNFFNSGSDIFGFNLVNFYGSWKGLLVGYQYTAFLDQSILPSTLDWEGPNSLAVNYNPQIRYTWPFAKVDKLGTFSLIGSIEAAEPSITGTIAQSGFGRTPDGVLAFRLEGDSWHAQVGGLGRSLSAQTPTGMQDDFGWGIAGSAGANVFKNDQIMVWGNAGRGIATYIQDTYAQGLDAVVNNDGVLETLPIYSAGIGYTHQWSKAFSSTLTYGYVHVEDTGYALMNPFTMQTTQYASANLLWQINPALSTGVEYLFGYKEAINGNSGEVSRVQFSLKYQFNP